MRIFRQFLCTALIGTLIATGASAQQLYVGAAKRETTPKQEWLPLPDKGAYNGDGGRGLAGWGWSKPTIKLCPGAP